MKAANAPLAKSANAMAAASTAFNSAGGGKIGAGGKVNAAVRLKVLLVKKLEALEQRVQLDEKVDPADPLKGMLTLARALEKVVDIEAKEKRRDDGASAGRLIINDATREALARRLEALADSWEANRERKAGVAEGRDLGPLPPHA